MIEADEIYCARCPLTGRLRRLSAPVRLLLRHSERIGLAAAGCLALTVTFWLSSLEAPAIRSCGGLLADAVRWQAPLRPCQPEPAGANWLTGPNPRWLGAPAAAGQSLTRSPSPSALRHGPSGD